MRLTLLLFLALPALAIAQRPPYTHRSSDSASYYRNQLYDMERSAMDSLRRSERYLYLRDRIEKIEKTVPSADYTAITLFADIAGADYDKLNASIAQSGFSPFDDKVYRVGYGISYSIDRAMIDLAFFAVGLKNKAQKTGEHITSTFSSYFQFDLGYDLLKPKWINLYPYAGLSYRTSSLKYNKAVQVNNSFTDVTNIIINDQTVKERCNKLAYQAGVGLDIVIKEQHPRLPSAGIMLFVKAGTNRIFGKEVYDIQGIEYRPGIEYGNWIVSGGIKIFGR